MNAPAPRVEEDSDLQVNPPVIGAGEGEQGNPGAGGEVTEPDNLPVTGAGEGGIGYKEDVVETAGLPRRSLRANLGVKPGRYRD